MSQALSNLAVGSKVKFGSYSVNGEAAQSIVWTIVAKNHTGYPSNSVTLHTSEIIDIRCFDAKEPKNSSSDRKDGGNNYYSVSNIDQWLNKDSVAGEWYVAAHSMDQSPNTASYTGNDNTQYASHSGFLNDFTTQEKAAILPTTIRVVKPIADGGSYEDIVRKVFLPSTTEVGLSNENSIAEGTSWGHYTTTALRTSRATVQCYNNSRSSLKPSSQTANCAWWLRTPWYQYSNYVRIVNASGGLNSSKVYNSGYGIRPALNLSNTLKVSDTTDSDGCYTFTWPNHLMPWVGGTETYTENETRNVEVSLGDLKEADYADELVSFTAKSGEQTSFYVQTGWAFDTGNYCRLEAQGALASGATESCSLTFTKALTGVTIKCEWDGYDTDTDVADTITCYFKGNVVFEKTGTSASHTTDRYTLENVAEGDVVTVSFTRSGTTTKSDGKIREGYTLHFYSDPITLTETVPVQKTRGINKPVSSIYAGVIATVPVYTETTTTEDIALSSATFTDFFSANNTGTKGTNAKGITWTNNSGGGLKLTFGNYGINSSTSMTTFTAQRDLTNVVIKGLYYTETRYDKITLIVAGTTVLNAVSGTSSTLTQRWSGSLSKGQTIVLKFVKDSSQSASSEKSTYFTLSCDPYQKTVTTKTQTGTETKLVDKKIVKGYVGGPDGKARLFFGENKPFSYTGEYTEQDYTDSRGVAHKIYTLTTSGKMTIYKKAEYWMCGGGASGFPSYNGQTGYGGCGGYTATNLLTDHLYQVLIGSGGAEATAQTSNNNIGNTTSIVGAVSYTANGGADVRGGSGGGGQSLCGMMSGTSTGRDGEHISTVPFSLSIFKAHSAGGGGGASRYYYSGGSNIRWNGGDGGSNGEDGGAASKITTGYPFGGAGGIYGGGNGGGYKLVNSTYQLTTSSAATFYGGGGGGGYRAKISDVDYHDRGAAGYQGVVYIAIPPITTT